MFGLAPGIDGGEVIVILVVALIVVGPKDLPGLIRRVGKFLGRMRAMAGDFRASFDEMARQSELDDLRREIQEMKGIGPYAKDSLVGDASAVSADIEAELQKPPASAQRPFAPAEPVDDEAAMADLPAPPPLARASRPFATAMVEDTNIDASTPPLAGVGPFGVMAPVAVTNDVAAEPGVAVRSAPSPLASTRPFAPAIAPGPDEPPLERRQA